MPDPVTPPPVAHEPKLGVAPPSKHWEEVPVAVVRFLFASVVTTPEADKP